MIGAKIAERRGVRETGGEGAREEGRDLHRRGGRRRRPPPTRDLARTLTEACPVDIFAQGGDGALEIVEREPRRVRALPAVPGRLAHGRRAVIKLYDDDAVLA